MIENWERKEDDENKNKSLMLYLDSDMQNDFKEQVLSVFRERSDKGLLLLTSLFNVNSDVALMHEYFQCYKESEPNFKKIMI